MDNIRNNIYVFSEACRIKKATAFFIVFSAFVLGIASIFLLHVKQKLIDYAVSGIAERAVTLLIVAASIMFFESALRSAVPVAIKKISQHMYFYSMSSVLRKSSHIKTEEYEKSYSQSIISDMESYDIGCTEFFSSLSGIIQFGVRSAGIFYIIYRIDLFFFLVCMFFSILIMYIQKKYSEKNSGFWDRYIHNARYFNRISEILITKEYVSEGKIFENTEFLKKKFSESYDYAGAENRNLGKNRFSGDLICEIFFAVFGFMAFGMWAPRLADRTVSPGTFYVMVEAVIGIKTGILSITDNISRMQRFSYICFRIKKYSEEPSEKAELSKDISSEIQKLDKELEKMIFKDVTFFYPGAEKSSISNFSFEFIRDTHYAVVGTNGSGKTTLSLLMMGIYSSYSGSITVVYDDGTYEEMRNISIEKKNRIFTGAFQNGYMYPLTVRESIGLGSGTCEDEEIKTVLRKMGMLKKVEKMKNGIDTPLGLLDKNGILLSGGEQKKISISRILAADKAVKILDEPTSSLDPVAEKEFYDLYSSVMTDNMTLFISHRLGSTMFADIIIVMDSGSLAEWGTHSRLMEKDGLYSSMFEAQKSLYM